MQMRLSGMAEQVGDLHAIGGAQEARLARQFRSDVGKSDWFDGVDFNGALFHRVALADGDAAMHPDPDSAGDFAAADAFAKAFGEDHQGLR